jgi:parvulin-like peptidyl-prolyl isomerase
MPHPPFASATGSWAGPRSAGGSWPSSVATRSRTGWLTCSSARRSPPRASPSIRRRVEERKKRFLAELEGSGTSLVDFLKASGISPEGFELNVWNRVASDRLAEAIGVRVEEVPRFLSLNFPPEIERDRTDAVLFRVGDEELTVRELVEALLPGIDADARETALERMKVAEAQRLAVENVAPPVTDEAVNRLVAEARSRIREESGGRGTLEAFLRLRRQTMETYRRALRRQEQLRRAILAETSEEELRAHFTRWEVFFRGRKVRVQHILVRVAAPADEARWAAALERAETIRTEALQEGSDFGELALRYSDDAGTKLRRGEIGLVPRKHPLYAEAFTKAAFALKRGEISEPVRAGQGWHILRAAEIVPGEEVAFEGVQEAVARDYADSHLDGWLARRREELEIEVLWDELRVKR